MIYLSDFCVQRYFVVFWINCRDLRRRAKNVIEYSRPWMLKFLLNSKNKAYNFLRYCFIVVQRIISQLSCFSYIVNNVLKNMCLIIDLLFSPWSIVAENRRCGVFFFSVVFIFPYIVSFSNLFHHFAIHLTIIVTFIYEFNILIK